VNTPFELTDGAGGDDIRTVTTRSSERGFTLKRFWQTAAVAVAFASVAAPANAAGRLHLKKLSTSGLLRPIAPFRDATITSQRRLAAVRTDADHGLYRTADGYSVHLLVSDVYATDRTADQSFVDFLDGLLHKTELGTLTVDIEAADELQLTCGVDALACYFLQQSTLYVPGEDPDPAHPLEQIIAHEYGHHVARSRNNYPWPAAIWGPKRWASYMNVCANVQDGHMFPGAETADQYAFNPGEGWAEAYRAVNAARIGTWGSIGWDIVDPFFIPDAGATNAVVADVLSPWSAPRIRTIRGRFYGPGARTWSLPTADDGVITASVRSANGTRLGFFAGQKLVSQPGARTSATVCGQTSLTLVAAARRKGAFTVTLATP
jgi:hypothetical protein